MNPYKNHTLDELLGMSLNKDVFDRMLEIFEQMQQADLGSRRETIQVTQMRPNSNTVAMPVKQQQPTCPSGG